MQWTALFKTAVGGIQFWVFFHIPKKNQNRPCKQKSSSAGRKALSPPLPCSAGFLFAGSFNVVKCSKNIICDYFFLLPPPWVAEGNNCYQKKVPHHNSKPVLLYAFPFRVCRVTEQIKEMKEMDEGIRAGGGVPTYACALAGRRHQKQAEQDGRSICAQTIPTPLPAVIMAGAYFRIPVWKQT